MHAEGVPTFKQNMHQTKLKATHVTKLSYSLGFLLNIGFFQSQPSSKWFIKSYDGNFNHLLC